MILTRDKSFYKSLIMLSIPIALQNLITFCVGLADNVMIGTLGDTAVSGVYMGSQIQTLLQIFSAGIDGAVLILAAQYWGRRDTERIRRIVSIGVRASAAFGALISVICISAPRFVISLFTNDTGIIESGAVYLKILAFSFVFFCLTQSLITAMRSVETARLGLWVSLISLFVNVALNYILIFGHLGFEPMGVAGAATATLISRICECIITAVYVLFIDKKLKFALRELVRLDKELLSDFIRYGTPIIAGQIVWAVNMMSNSAIMGRQNVDGVVTGLSIANTLNNLAYVTMNGMSAAVGVITGKTIGEGKDQLMREYARTVQVLFLCLGIVTGTSLFLIKRPFVSLYAVSAAACEQAYSMINVLCITSVGTCYQAACLLGLVKSGGDTSFVFKNDTIFVFLIVIPSAIAATAMGASPWIVFACLKCDQILKCIVAFIKINRFDWMKNLTRNEN